MKTFIALVWFASTSLAHAGSLNLQGNCTGKTLSGMDVALTYYSDYDGKKKESEAAVSFTEGRQGLQTGKRAFKGSQDIYQFEDVKLSFKNSTGNTSGLLTYTDETDGKTKRTVELQCEIRDYEYF